MKKIVTCLFLFFSVLHAQTFEWVRHDREKYNTFGNQIEIDKQGNVYVASRFDYGPSKNPPSDAEGNFVSKYAPDGTLLWRLTGFMFLVDICLDPNDQLVVTDKDISATATGYYYARYNASGTLIQVQNLLPMSAAAMIYSHEIDGSGNHYISGFFQDTISIGTHSVFGSGLNQLFYAKLDASDQCLWLKTTSNLCTSDAIIKMDPQGGFYLTGSFQQTMAINQVSLVATDYFGNGFIGKFDFNGNMQWLKKLNAQSIQYPGPMAFDQSGNIYMTSSYSKILSIPGTTLYTGPADFDLYLMKMDAQANPIWLKSLHSANYDFPSGISLNPSGEIYLAGSFDQELQIDTIAKITSTASTPGGYLPATESFLAKFTNNGILIWALQSGYSNGTNGGAGQIAFNSGAVYMTGWITGGADFGQAGPIQTFGSEMFLTKISDDAYVNIEEDTKTSSLLLYPNPVRNLLQIKNTNESFTISIYNCQGDCVLKNPKLPAGEQELDLGFLAAGVYFARIESAHGIQMRKVVKAE